MSIAVDRHIVKGSALMGDSPQTTHDKVKKRIMQLLKKWSGQFKKDETLGIVEETYDQLKKTCQ